MYRISVPNKGGPSVKPKGGSSVKPTGSIRVKQPRFSWPMISILLLILLAAASCKSDKTIPKASEQVMETNMTYAADDANILSKQAPAESRVAKKIAPVIDYDSLVWSELTGKDGFVLDLKYATTDNFTKQVIYDCPRCFVRPLVAAKLKQINKKVQAEKGLTIKLFDCYRPRPAQAKLWKLMPNETYVTHPSKGSMHNKGAAVDVSFVDKTGQEVNMGTAFDAFERASRHSYTDLPLAILEHRRYLKQVMQSAGFKSITSEWWHYSLNGTGGTMSDWVWACQTKTND